MGRGLLVLKDIKRNDPICGFSNHITDERNVTDDTYQVQDSRTKKFASVPDYAGKIELGILANHSFVPHGNNSRIRCLHSYVIRQSVDKERLNITCYRV
jgi:hypothetical protein